jgi:hypothetical protein
MLDAPEAFFFGSRDQRTVAYDAGGRVRMIGIDAEYQ